MVETLQRVSAKVRGALRPVARHHVGTAQVLCSLRAQSGDQPLVGGTLRILNVGAGSNCWLEDELRQSPGRFQVDRTDVLDPTVQSTVTGNCWRVPVEAMRCVPSCEYDAVVMNYVLEHVRSPRAAASELWRVLKPGGHLYATIPNPLAPEFLIARATPHSLHRVFQPNASPTHYAFSSVGALVRLFEAAGFKLEAEHRAPHVGVYLARVGPVLAPMGNCYDAAVTALGISFVMGDVFLALRKGPIPGRRTAASNPVSQC